MNNHGPILDIVVSAQNNDYLAWQCLLFHHTCIKHFGQAPIMMVHGGNEPLCAGYGLLLRHGGKIQRAPDYCNRGGISFEARNHPGSLRHVESEAEYLVFCDPDMILFRPTGTAELLSGLGSAEMSASSYAYMIVHDRNRQTLETLAQRHAIDMSGFEASQPFGGVPYVLRNRDLKSFAAAWDVLTEDYFTISLAGYGAMNSEIWISPMWGFVLAARQRGLQVSRTELGLLNWADDPLPVPEGPSRFLHYCYPHESFDKRAYAESKPALDDLWRPRARRNTLHDLLADAIEEAALHYGLGDHPHDQSPRVSESMAPRPILVNECHVDHEVTNSPEA